MKRLSVILAVVTLLIGVSTTSFATMIDFTDGSWSAALNDPNPYSVGDTTIEAIEPDGATLWWDATDGIGVQSNYENDEIEGDERLEVSFLEPTYLNTIYIADLFIEGDPVYTETGSYSLDGGGWVDFEAITAGNNGELTIDVGGVLVTTILFKAPGAGQEFAVQGLDVTPVPEPGTIALLGMGLVGLIGAGARRRRNRKKKS